MKALKVVLNDSAGDRLRRVAEAFGVSVKALAEALVEEGLCDVEMCTALLTHIDVPDVARRAAALRTAYGDKAGPRIRALLRDLGVAKPEAVSFALRALGAALARHGRRRAAGGPGGVPRKGANRTADEKPRRPPPWGAETAPTAAPGTPMRSSRSEPARRTSKGTSSRCRERAPQAGP